MPSIQQPYPPSPPTAQLEFDQRGPCWPLGPCSYRNRIQIRYDVIGVWLSGPPDPDWNPWDTGQLMMPLIDGYSKTHIQLEGMVRPDTFSTDGLIIQKNPESATGWRILLQSVISLAPDRALQLIADMPTQLCINNVSLTPTTTIGTNPPDLIQITPRWWWIPASFNYYGP